MKRSIFEKGNQVVRAYDTNHAELIRLGWEREKQRRDKKRAERNAKRQPTMELDFLS